MFQRIIFTLVLIGSCRLVSYAQIDTEFWFAAPEVTTIHADRPIFLRVSTLDFAAEVTVSLPAIGTFTPIKIALNANSTGSIDLTPFIDVIENKPPNQILTYGIYIKSTNPITAYYEVLGSTNANNVVNTDIFALKGSHALGLKFYVPFQTHWNNNGAVDSWASFDIVASENNTSITITPTQDLFGHPAGVPFIITLNKGQTFSSRAMSILGNLRPTGTLVTSSKPIAITIKDDSMYEPPNYDLAGDQIIPVNYIGKDYIAIRNSSTISSDRIYIVATKNNTSVFLDGNATAVALLNEGETFEHTLINPTAYISSSDSIYVWHISGFSKELGGAILPPIGCTGSRQVSFTRSNAELFFLSILVKSGYENYFKLNNNSSTISGGFFMDVPGTSGIWKFARIPFDITTIPVNSGNIIKNDSADFQLALTSGGSSTGFRYGYFSDFGFLELGSDRLLCEGDSLEISAGFYQDSYLWNTGATSFKIMVKDTGQYQVQVSKGVCSNKDSIHIGFYPKFTTPILGNDTSFCRNTIYSINTIIPYVSYLWSTGNTSEVIKPTTSGTYTVNVTNTFGCKKQDTIAITILPAPYPEIIYDENLDPFCKASEITLSSNENFVKYFWNTGDTTKSVITPHLENDHYTLAVINEFNCYNKTSLQIDCSPILGLIPNLITPNGDSLNDTFYVEFLKPQKWILEVYNRWGDLVYKKYSYDNSFNGDNLSEDIYYFTLRHIEDKGYIKSWIQIIR